MPYIVCVLYTKVLVVRIFAMLLVVMVAVCTVHHSMMEMIELAHSHTSRQFILYFLTQFLARTVNFHIVYHHIQTMSDTCVPSFVHRALSQVPYDRMHTHIIWRTLACVPVLCIE